MPMTKANPSPANTQESDIYLAVALARGLRTLHLLAEARTPLPLAEISRRLNLTRGVAFRLVHTLEVEGYIERVDQVPNYRPAAKVMSLGFSYLRTLGLPELARVELEQLRSTAAASVHLAVLDKREVVYVSRLPAKEGGVDYLEIGDRSPAHASAIGLAMLSQLSSTELNALFEPDALVTTGTDIDLPDLLDQLSEIQRKGYASSVGALHPNVLAIAAPILDAAGMLAGAVSITTLEPDAQSNEPLLSGYVIAAARQISEKLGFTTSP
ncbi:IclR family transcriptional regulator [Pusillimonas caeni]|nr:IclR family transcriptional regulator [Pusillimonas caeni]